MANLRYLELSGDKIKTLPSSLGNLQHLQTLDLKRTKVRSLPKSIWLIKTLRYLYGSKESTGLEMPDVNPPFDNIRALRSIRAKKWMKDFLPVLNNLQELEIHIECDGKIPDYLCTTIDSLQRLKVLIIVRINLSLGSRITLDMGKIFRTTYDNLHTLEISQFFVEPSVLLELPQSLKQVKLADARIDHRVIKLLGKLPYLQLLRFSKVSIAEEKMIFESDWFPQLIVLVLDNLDIKTWELVGQSLPLLRKLEISRCSLLQALPKNLPPRVELKIVQCPGLA